jgi:hypothetical protein
MCHVKSCKCAITAFSCGSNLGVVLRQHCARSTNDVRHTNEYMLLVHVSRPRIALENVNSENARINKKRLCYMTSII